MPRKIKRIILHHSLTKDGTTVNWHAIERYHKYTNGWRDIGYHFGVERAGSHYVAVVGRRLDWVGAHTKCLNTDSIGIVVIGNYDLAPPPQAKLYVLFHRLLFPLMNMFKIPVEMVQGHREAHVAVEYEGLPSKCLRYNRKSCPGWNFSMKSIRDVLIANGFPVRDGKYLKKLNNFDEAAIKRKKIVW